MAEKRSKRKTAAAKKKPRKAKAKAVTARAKPTAAEASTGRGDIDLLRSWSPSRYSSR
jgi:hypothetical protein